jgi:hypothetical protein
MTYRGSQLDVTHTFPSHLRVGNLDTTTVTDNSLIPDRLELSAVAFPLLGSSKNPFTKKSIFLGSQSPIVNSFRLFNFAVAPGSNLIWRGQFDHYAVKILNFPHASSLVQPLAADSTLAPETESPEPSIKVILEIGPLAIDELFVSLGQWNLLALGIVDRNVQGKTT